MNTSSTEPPDMKSDAQLDGDGSVTVTSGSFEQSIAHPCPPTPDDYSPHQLDAAERDMQVALDGYPALTPSGFYVSPRPMAIPRSVEWFGPIDAVISREGEIFAFWQSRMAMRTEEALAAFISCRAWLRTHAVKRKSLSKGLDSEKLRNVAAQHIGVVDHGSRRTSCN